MKVERLADERDIDAVVALESESFTNPWSRETLVWELQNSDVTRIYIGRADGGAVVAFCACWVVFDELHVNTLAVAPAERKKGLATVLMRAVMTEAAREGARRATLEVRVSNEAALRLYTALGFRIRATRPSYYTNPEEDAYILWLDSLGPNLEGP